MALLKIENASVELLTSIINDDNIPIEAIEELVEIGFGGESDILFVENDVLSEVSEGLSKNDISFKKVTKIIATDIQWDTDEEDSNEDIELPSEMEIPDHISITDAEDISDYLSDETGFCHGGYCLTFETE